MWLKNAGMSLTVLVARGGAAGVVETVVDRTVVQRLLDRAHLLLVLTLKGKMSQEMYFFSL